jgi:integrase
LRTFSIGARVRQLREGDNPARWRGHLDHVLPAQSKLQRVKHHAALPYSEVGAFMTHLRNRPGITPRALEFTILTATRRGEVRGARWSEIKDGVWTIPPERMKGEKDHRIPLSKRALELLASLPREGDFIFPGARAQQPLSVNAPNHALDRMGRSDLTVHGFRSTFRDWAAETTGYPNHVVEMALAHAIGDAVEAAYRRGDLFEKRRRLMQDWADYCERGRVKGDVVPLRSQK